MRRGRVPLLAAVAAVAIGAFASRAGAQPPSELSAAQIAMVCAPSPSLAHVPAKALRVMGGQDTTPHTMFSSGDLVILSGGMAAGVALDQRYLLRRPVRFGAYGMHTSKDPGLPETSGWIRVVAVNQSTAVARVDYSCDAVMPGDYLEPFVAPVVAESSDAAMAGDPDFSALGRVLYGSGETSIAGTGDVILINRGSDQGVVTGARFAIYRDLESGVPLVPVGEGLVISTSNRRSLIRILSAKTAVESGDFVARRAVTTQSQ